MSPRAFYSNVIKHDIDMENVRDVKNVDELRWNVLYFEDVNRSVVSPAWNSERLAVCVCKIVDVLQQNEKTKKS